MAELSLGLGLPDTNPGPFPLSYLLHPEGIPSFSPPGTVGRSTRQGAHILQAPLATALSSRLDDSGTCALNTGL